MKKIGFIGLGIMGNPMATNLIGAGYQVTGYDIDEKALNAMVEKGAAQASSPKEAAGSADAIITMVPDDPIAERVATGKDGALEGMRKGTILVDMSTISPSTAMRIAEKLEENGMEMLDAPVSGGDVGAMEGTLSIMVGGKKEIFDRMLPVLEKMGKNVNHVGDHGAGQVAKDANQIIVALTIEAVAEALIFAKKSGVDPKRVRDALMGGFAQSRVLDLHGQRMLDWNFEPGGRVRLHKKDTEIAMSMAKELGMYLPGTSLVSQLWNTVAAHGGLDWDHSSLVKVLELMSETEVRPG
ncbi:MAG: 2-hydroxy-3-oxopropionate reductase [Proteobacteria bacterium]|nr:2-hydroxy-3-oxopropionate reductase [Pseudomonadota bacterium]NIS60864.1 2-hydroxy-3-oxopropionate reductase [Pseudomonadota bacterium]